MTRSDLREGILLLEDGAAYRGVCASPGTAFGEVVFNTSMTGYQEILTDPSYRRQIVVMTQPHIGNYGTQDEVAESRRPWAEGFIARRFTPRPSSHRNEVDLVEYLRERQVPALSGIDTRAVVRRLRDRGAMRGVVSDRVDALDALREQLLDSPKMVGQALVDEVTLDAPRSVEPTRPSPTCPSDGAQDASDRRPPHVAIYDFGAKESIARHLAARGARVTLLPARTSAADCLALVVDGVMLSNGPGDPEPLGSIIDTVRELVAADVPLFGICLGHQLLGLAMGGSTFKMKFGHHGGNQPVQDLDSGQVVITSQNHGFAVDPDSLPDTVRVSHRNLNDGTVEGLAVVGRSAFSVQFHPEAAPGPHDALGLFDRFLDSLTR